MEVLILQLSDIHLKAGENENPVLQKIKSLRGVLNSTMRNYELCLVLVTGDIAQSGKAQEFEIALSLFSEIDEILKQTPNIAGHEFISIPGNHDCDLSKDDKSRRAIIDKLLSRPDDHDESMLENCLRVQDPYFQFIEAAFQSDAACVDHKLYSKRSISCGTHSIEIGCFNTAWLSTDPEQMGRLLPPPGEIYDTAERVGATPALSIALLHHPFNWMLPEISKKLQRHLHDRYDLVLTGHEHVSDHYRKIPSSGDASDFLEGGVLQESGEAETSSFNAVSYNLDNREFVIHKVEWDGDSYLFGQDSDIKKLSRRNDLSSGKLALNQNYLDGFLLNPGAQYTHPRRDRIELEDIYIPPDHRRLSSLRKRSKSKDVILSGTRAQSEIQSNKYVALTGSEKVGKTSALKMQFLQTFRSGEYPVLLSGEGMKSSSSKDILQAIKRAIAHQYEGKAETNYLALDRDQKVILFDDFHLIAVNGKGKADIIDYLKGVFGRVVIAGDDVLRIEQISGNREYRRLFEECSHFQLLEFGHLLREKLVSRWILLGGEDVLEEEDYGALLREKMHMVSVLLGKNLIPSYPIFILVLLQQMEAGRSTRTASGSFGYFYEELITNAFSKAVSQKDTDKFYNLTAELSFRLYGSDTRNVEFSEFEDFVSYYCDAYQLRLNASDVRTRLLDAGILVKRGNCMDRFQYKYVFYYFVARHICHNLSFAERQSMLIKLVDSVHTERSANIIIFLSYLSRDPGICDALLTASREIYGDVEVCDMDGHVQHLCKLQKEVPKYVIPSGDPQTSRRETLRRRDETAPRTSLEGHLPDDDDEVRDDADIDEIIRINRAFKMLQVLGQVVRNFSGSLKGDLKEEITRECFSVGLRSVNFIYSQLGDNLDDMLVYFASKLREEFPDLIDREVAEQSRSFLFGLCEMVASGLARKISCDVGSSALAATYETVLGDAPSNAFRMIDVAIKMDHQAKFPADQIIALHNDMEKNIFGQSVLANLVVSQFYLYNVPQAIRDRVCIKLGIKIDGGKALSQQGKKVLRAPKKL